MEAFFTRLERVCAERGRLCVGIDPHPNLIQSWGYDVNTRGLEAVARGMVEALGDMVACFKPQMAFYEPYGSAGIAVMERVLADIRQAGALCIMDAKRGDIGSTNAGYAAAYVVDDSPLAADALTMNPYLGVGALEPAFGAATASGRGIYLLCRTSNPEGASIQTADAAGRSVAQLVIDEAAARNAAAGQNFLGLVIGATNTDLDVDLSQFDGSVLMPGVGAQGGTLQDIDRLLGDKAKAGLPTTSRGVMKLGPDKAALRTGVADLIAQMRVLG